LVLRDEHPTRAELAARRGADLVRGGPTKADLWLSSLADGTAVVVKDFAAKILPVRWWGRLQIRREAMFLALLQDLPEVPRLHGRIDGLAFAMEYLADARPLFGRESGPRWAPVLARIRAALDVVQARGIAHLDLRGRENVVLRGDGERIVVLDWAGALRFPERTLRRRLFWRLAKLVDDSAYIKWKDMLDPGSLTPEDLRFKERFRRIRKLWPFNRKGLGWTRE